MCVHICIYIRIYIYIHIFICIHYINIYVYVFVYVFVCVFVYVFVYVYVYVLCICTCICTCICIRIMYMYMYMYMYIQSMVVQSARIARLRGNQILLREFNTLKGILNSFLLQETLNIVKHTIIAIDVAAHHGIVFYHAAHSLSSDSTSKQPPHWPTTCSLSMCTGAGPLRRVDHRMCCVAVVAG